MTVSCKREIVTNERKGEEENKRHEVMNTTANGSNNKLEIQSRSDSFFFVH